MKYSIAFAAVAGALCLGPAQARDDHATPHSRIVSYADLDLKSESGRDTLNHRMRVAVHTVCGDASTSDLAASNRIRTCRKVLMRRAKEISDDMATAAVRPAVNLATASAR